MYVAGIDEAGRGPVLGPMVMTIAVGKVEDLDKLKELGVKDSKLILPEKRRELYKKLKKMLEFKTISVSAAEIDKRRKIESLNIIELKTSADLINFIETKLERVYVDCPDINPDKYKEKLKAYLEKNHKLIVEHKADMNYLIVGAASIIAKVERDLSMVKLEKKYKLELGSGYPHDPKVVAFLKTLNGNEKFPFIRKSWQSYINAINNLKQNKLF
jgi:ribonuclease HII